MKSERSQSPVAYIEGASDETWVTDKQLAERLSVSRATIWRLVQRGVIPQPDKIGGATRFRQNASIAAVLGRQ